MIEELQTMITDDKNKRNALYFEAMRNRKWENFDSIPFTIDYKISISFFITICPFYQFFKIKNYNTLSIKTKTFYCYCKKL